MGDIMNDDDVNSMIEIANNNTALMRQVEAMTQREKSLVTLLWDVEEYLDATAGYKAGVLLQRVREALKGVKP